MNVKILFDNNVFNNKLTTGHGFSCLVELNQMSLLFDTGSDSSILLNNMNRLRINHEDIDTIMLSHIHNDHVGGLSGFLEQKRAVTIYLLASFPRSYKDRIESLGATVEEVEKHREVFPGIYTTGELGSDIREQSLVINTTEGTLIVTGCAHPGILEIIKKAQYIIPGKMVYLVMGGFHLSGASSKIIKYIADSFVELGVATVAPCHCSGDEARKIFKKQYEEKYIESGVGKIITLL